MGRTWSPRRMQRWYHGDILSFTKHDETDDTVFFWSMFCSAKGPSLSFHVSVLPYKLECSNAGSSTSSVAEQLQSLGLQRGYAKQSRIKSLRPWTLKHWIWSRLKWQHQSTPSVLKLLHFPRNVIEITPSDSSFAALKVARCRPCWVQWLEETWQVLCQNRISKLPHLFQLFLYCKY